MAWHIDPISKPDCREPFCQKAATVTLHNSRNELVGHYCRRHGKAAVERYNRAIPSAQDRGSRGDDGAR